MADDNTISAADVKIADDAACLTMSDGSIRRAIRTAHLSHIQRPRAARIVTTDLDAFAAAHRGASKGDQP